MNDVPASDQDRRDAFAALLDERWSCRAFLPDPVPGPTITDMLALAQRTASWCNTQPWHVHLVTGTATTRFRETLLTHVATHPPVSDFPPPERYTGIYQDRRRESGFALYASLGIAREDRAARDRQMLRNYEFFGAPHVAVVSTDRDLGVYGAVDCGGYITNLMQAAHALGVATCPQAAIALYGDLVREFLKLPQDRLILAAVSFGFADQDDPANAFRTSRAGVSESVTIVAG